MNAAKLASESLFTAYNTPRQNCFSILYCSILVATQLSLQDPLKSMTPFIDI